VPTKRRGSNRTATSRVPLVGPNEPKPTWSGRGDPIAKKGAERQRTTGHRGQGEQAHQGRRKKRPPPKAQAASLVSAVTPLLSSATPLAPPAPHDDRLSVPSVRSRCRRCTRSCRAPRAGCSAAAGLPPGRTGKSRAFLFSPLACAFLGFGTGIGRPCLLSSRGLIVSSNFTSSQIVVRFID
jgi:hypothetical protein